MNTRAPMPLPPSPVDELVDAWREAKDRHARLESRWPLIRLVLWPTALAAIVLIAVNAHGPLAWIPAVVATAGIVGAIVHTSLMNQAASDIAEAWTGLREHTGLTDSELELLVQDDEIEEVA